MKDGRLFESGTHEDLMTRKGEYFTLFNAQVNTAADDKATEYDKTNGEDAYADEPTEDHTMQDFTVHDPAKREDLERDDTKPDMLGDSLSDSGVAPALRRRHPQRAATS